MEICASQGKGRRRSLWPPALFFMLAASLLVLLSVHLAQREVLLVVDGESRTVTTFAHTVGAFLEEQEIVLGQADLLSHALEETMQRTMHVELKTAFPVSVAVDGGEQSALVAEATVGDFLDKLGIFLGELDRVEPKLSHTLERGDAVQIVRVERRLVTEKTEVPYRESRRGSQTLDRGESRVLQQGAAGLREDTVEIILEDGEEVSVKVVESEILRARQDRVVEVGENTVLSRGGRNVRFERVFRMTATAYCAGTEQSGCPTDENGRSACTGRYNNGRTATGRKAVAGNGREENPHIVAVDPRVIPLGSRLYIDGYGYAIAADTGGSIKGNRIDLLLGSHSSALRFGRRTLRVYLLP